MIVTKTPLRLSLGGGGTDLLPYASKYGSMVISIAIDKYIYICAHKCFDSKIRLKYSKSEVVDKVDDIEHNVYKEVLKLFNIENGIEIASLADIPHGTGLGSSGSFSVGLIHALYKYKCDLPLYSLMYLVDKALYIEITKLGYPVGTQDQSIAAYGGLCKIETKSINDIHITQLASNYFLDSYGNVLFVPLVDMLTLQNLNDNLLLFYTNIRRSANEILYKQNEMSKQVVEGLHKVQELGYKVYEALVSGNITDIGLLFDEHWKHKKSMMKEMTNSQIDYWYEEGKKNGALGAKIAGAGGGGTMLFYVEKNHSDFINKMEAFGLTYIPFRFEFKGSRVIIDD